MLKKIVFSVRASDDIPDDFIIGIKLNAADYVVKEHDTDRSDRWSTELPFRHVKEISAWEAVDFIEISGGNYENPGQWFLPVFSVYISS